MKFPAESLAVLASQSRGSEGFDVRQFAVNANINIHSNKQEQSRADEPEAKTGKSITEVASTIVNKLNDLQNVVECDPLQDNQETRRLQNHHGHFHHDEESTFDADFGILSSSACGLGRKCEEGLCVDVDEYPRRNLQAFTDSALEGEIPFSMAIDVLKYVCEVGSAVGYDCDCNVDDDAYTGNIFCVTPVLCANSTSVCGSDVTDCYQTTHNFELKGTPGAIDNEYCKEFVAPFEQTVCYQTSTIDFGENVLQDCKISLDGEECSYCHVYRYFNDYGDQECFTFDCSNTALAGNGRGNKVGNTCVTPAHGMSLYVETYGCPSCDLCGDGLEINAGLSSVELFNKTYDCSYVQGVALAGYFTQDTCSYFTYLSREACCTGEVATETQTPIVIENHSPCQICPNGVMNPNAMLSISGSDEISCSSIEIAGRTGGIPDKDLCQALQEQAVGPCCTPLNVPDEITDNESVEASCSICGPSGTHTKPDDTLVSVPTQGIYTCGELMESGKNGTLDENGICLLVQLSAKTPCGCVSDDPTDNPSTVSTGDAYQVPSPPSSGMKTSIATTVAMIVGGSTLLSYFLC